MERVRGTKFYKNREESEFTGCLETEYTGRHSPKSTLSLFDQESWTSQGRGLRPGTEGSASAKHPRPRRYSETQTTWKPCLPRWSTCGPWLPRLHTPPKSPTHTGRRRDTLGCVIRTGHSWVEGRWGREGALENKPCLIHFQHKEECIVSSFEQMTAL